MKNNTSNSLSISFFAASTCNDSNTTIFNDSTMDIALWNRWLGHASLKVLQKINELSISGSHKEHYCIVCSISKHIRLLFSLSSTSSAKQVRLPFSLCSTSSTKYFNLVHVDICGPYRVPTYCDKRWFLIIVDDHSKCAWIFLLNLKNKVIVVLEKFVLMIQS